MDDDIRLFRRGLAYGFPLFIALWMLIIEGVSLLMSEVWPWLARLDWTRWTPGLPG